MRSPTYQDLTEEVSPKLLTAVDRGEVNYDVLTDRQRRIVTQWVTEGVAYLPRFMPELLMREYEKLREKLKKPGGWANPCPYLHYKAIRDICLYRPLSETLKLLVGDDMGLHLNLTGWISTERSFHADDYLNPPFILAHYAAVWIALETVHPDSGPFQYVPGSHRWPLLRRDKVLSNLEPGALSTRDWPSRAEEFVTPACTAEIARRGAKVETYLPKRGDVLIWHGMLLHQGSKPKVPGTPRRALIAHYSALSKREDMPVRHRHTDAVMDVDGWYFDTGVEMDGEEIV